MITGCLQDYISWKLLILEIEKAPPEDINTVSLAYDSFLAKFPLCHWHLKKYAYQKAKFCNSQEAVNIYERAVEVARFSIGFWADYFTHAAACFESPADIRRLFERAISFVGRDYFCHVLWDKYMKYEFDQEGWNFLAQSYIWALRFPTKKLHFYYTNFKQFVANLEVEIGDESYDRNDSTVQQSSVPCVTKEVSKDEISLVIKDMLDSSNGHIKSKALDTYRSIGMEFYLGAQKMDEKIKRFETKIQRHYFDVTPLDDDQLNNWHLYLDFIEKQDNLDWAMKLYERCLIPCANYPEFWIRYVDFLESRGQRELAISALTRATQIFVKSAPEIHLFDARFKEHIGDTNGARAALALCDPKTDSSFIERIDALANLERRLGNLGAASATYEEALERARTMGKLHILPSLYSHCACLKFLITGSAAASMDVLIEGIRHVPHCRFLLEELIKFAMTHGGANHVNIIDATIADAISPLLDETEGLDANDRENISCLFLEFVNLWGSTHDIRKAWNRHIKLFPRSLRMKTAYTHPHPASGHHPKDLAGDKKGNGLDQHRGQEQATELQAKNEIQPNPVERELVLLKNQSNMNVESVQVMPTKEVVSSGDESRNSEPAHEISDGGGTGIASVESSDQGKEASTVREPPKLAHEVGKMSRGENVTKVIDRVQKPGLSTPPTSINTSGEQLPVSSAQQNMNPVASATTQQQWQAQNVIMNQMLQNNSQQQQLLQQLYLQQLRMPQQQYLNQQPYQVNPQQQNHQQQLSQGQKPLSNFQKVNNQSQDGSYQRLLLRQLTALQKQQQLSVQQYQSYLLKQRPLLKEGSTESTDRVQQSGVSTPPTSINTSGGQPPVSSAQQNMIPVAPATTQLQWRAQQGQMLSTQQQPYLDQLGHPVYPQQQNQQQQLSQGQKPLSNFQKVNDLSQDGAHQLRLSHQVLVLQKQQEFQRYSYILKQQQLLKEGSTSMKGGYAGENVTKATDRVQQSGVSTPPTSINTSGGQLPVSSAQQNMNPVASATTQQQLLAQQSRMLPNHFLQLQLLQQSNLQQMRLRQQQYMTQQPYQMDPQRQNHLQQSQDSAYQRLLSHQLIASQLQQSQQYQSHLEQQLLKAASMQGGYTGENATQATDRVQQSGVSTPPTSINTSGEQLPVMSQNQQDSTRAIPDNDAARHSESPHPEVHSPRALQ